MSPILFELSMSNYSCYLALLYSPRGYTCLITYNRALAIVGLHHDRDPFTGLHHDRDHLCDAALAMVFHQASLTATD